MSAQQTRLLGASIKSFTTSLGLNGQVSSLTIDLVEDKSSSPKLVYFEYNNDLTSFTKYPSPITVTTPDSFNPPSVGSPVYFQFGNNFSFGGILQASDEIKGFDGTYFRVTLNDPRTILSDCECILTGYNGSVQPLSNIFNIFGFWEDATNPLGGGFGQSLANEGGIPFFKLVQAINVLSNTGLFTNIYGGPYIKLMGYNYTVDLSSLPSYPPHYRIGPGNVNLLDAINQLLEDVGYDSYYTLVFAGSQLVIKVNCISRIFQANPGQIQSFINSTPNVNTENFGNELRNEYTSSFLVGGQKEYLWYNYAASGAAEQDKGIWPYWGVDDNGNAIIGRGDFNSNSHNFWIDTRFINIPVFPAAYNVTIGELRAALENFDIWSSYVVATKPAIANILNLTSSLSPDRVLNLLASGQTFTQFDLLSMGAQRTTLLGNRFEDGHPELYNAHILYEWIYKLANENYGRKFMVRIPNVACKIESDTGRISFSDVPSDGGWNDDNTLPLNLPSIYEDLFQGDDGRFRAMAFYQNKYLTVNGNVITSGDASELSPNNTLVLPDSIYIDGELDDFIVFTDQISLASPRVILNVNGRVLQNTKAAPSVDALVTFLQDSNNNKGTISQSTNTITVQTGINGVSGTVITQNGLDLIKKSLRGKDNGYIPELLNPPAVMPDQVSVPLRSNIVTYGPWYSVGPAGKTYFEQDNTLVPWNYGGINFMNFAASAKIAQKTTNLQVSERGTLTLPDVPSINLGDSLQFGAPIVNSIDVTIDEQQGIATTYKMELYTQRFGVMAKATFDTFSRITRNAQQFKRNFLQQQRNAAFLSGRTFNAPARGTPSKQVKTNTPHETIVLHTDPINKKTGASFLTADEGLGSLRTSDSGGFQSTSLASLDSLFQPFSCDPTGNIYLPHFITPATGAATPTVNDLNPFSGGNCQFLTFGNSLPSTFLPSDPSFDPTTVRAPAMRSPMILAGWGYDINGFPYPNASSGTKVMSFSQNYKTDPTKWFAGPLDARIDSDRGVWVTTSTLNLAVVAAVSGYFNNDPVNYRPRYVIRPITNIASGGALTYQDFNSVPPMSGSTDVYAFNLQENIGDKNTLAVGSPLIYYTKYGQTFFSELPRSFAHRTTY